MGAIGKNTNWSEFSSNRTMIPGRDKAFVSVFGGINTSEDREDFCLRFVQTFSTAQRLLQRSV